LLYKVFYHRDRELLAYTLAGTFEGEEAETKGLLAYENGISVDDIRVAIEERKRSHDVKRFVE